jgi:predicted transcriptional regulator
MMNVHVSEALVRKLNELAAASGRAAEDIVEDALAGYLDEVTRLRERLDARYDELGSGRIQPIGGDEAAARLREKSQRRRTPGV